MCFLVAQKNIRVDHPMQEDVYEIGVLCKIKHVLKLQGGALRVLASGVSRAKMLKCNIEEYYTAGGRTMQRKIS